MYTYSCMSHVKFAFENVHNSMFKNNPSKDNLKKKNLKI